MKNADAPRDLEPYPKALFETVVDAFPGWLSSRMREILSDAGIDVNPDISAEIDGVAQAASHVVTDALFALLVTDVDAQATNPLHVIRSATAGATDYLRACRVQPVARDEWDERALPDDVYAIGPIAWRDLGESVHEAGIEWGAWKAATVLTRRRSEGKIS